MVNAGVQSHEPGVNRLPLQAFPIRQGQNMAVQRKVFRIEEMLSGDTSAAEFDHLAKLVEQQKVMMAELQALRSLMAAVPEQKGAGRAAGDVNVKAIEAINAQIAEARKLKIEIDVIDQAIKKTKGEMESLQDHGLDGGQMARVTQELSAVVGGTTDATDRILKAAETIERSCMSLTAGLRTEHEIGLAQDIQEQITQIFEACNFHDLTSQRITKVVNTLRQVEDHIAQMVEIWSAIERFTSYVARLGPMMDSESLLNGPKLDGDEGHSSQNDIDALFH